MFTESYVLKSIGDVRTELSSAQVLLRASSVTLIFPGKCHRLDVNSATYNGESFY